MEDTSPIKRDKKAWLTLAGGFIYFLVSFYKN